LQFEVRGLSTNSEGGVKIGNLIYGSKGWMNIGGEDSKGSNKVHYGEVKIRPTGYSSYNEEDGPVFSPEPGVKNAVVAHFENFFNCVKSRRWQDLRADIEEGHMSTALCHLGNIACKLRRTLNFNPYAEKFVNDEEADSYLTKMYRAPYVLPDKV